MSSKPGMKPTASRSVHDPAQDLWSALATGARHVHLEISPDSAVLRGRIDGKLCRIGSMSPTDAMTWVERLEKLATEGAGILTAEDPPARIHFLLASAPAESGRRVVLTPLPASPVSTGSAESELHLPPHISEAADTFLRSARGLLLAGGPPDSGRSATLEALAARIARQRGSVLRLVDAGTAGSTGVPSLSAGIDVPLPRLLDLLRSLDPDCILLPEIDSRAAARRGLELAGAGYLVLAPFTAPSCRATVHGLGALCGDSQTLADRLACVISHRRLPEPCPVCGFRRRLSDSVPAWLESIGLDLSGAEIAGVVLRSRGTGCARCSFSGYRGWTRIHGFLPVRGTEANGSRACGTTLMEDAWRKITAGELDLDELRLLPSRPGSAAIVCKAGALAPSRPERSTCDAKDTVSTTAVKTGSSSAGGTTSVI